MEKGIGQRVGRMVLAMSRRPGTVAGAFALIGLAWSLGPGAAFTDAARYTVAQCGWKVGNDGGWYQSAADKFHSSAWCGVPEGSDAWEGIHVTSGTRPSTDSISGTRFARWRWQAPTGTGIVTVSGDRWHVLSDGFRHRLGGAAQAGGFTPFADFTETDKARSHFSRSFSPHAAAFESRLLCAKPDRSACLPVGTALAGVRALTLTLDDPKQPVPGVSDLPEPDRWVRGTVEFGFSASDAGSGLAESHSSVDGSAFTESAHACATKSIAGQLRATRMRPCPVEASGKHGIDTTRLTDGPHTFDHCALDFAGNSACVGARALLTDNTAPSPPRRLAVVGGGTWRNANGFALTWENPGQGRAAPITAAHFRATGPEGPVGEQAPADTTTGIEELMVPAAGEYAVSVWLEDAAGNVDPAAESTTTVRLDDVLPSAQLTQPQPDDPDLLTVPVSDLHSGVAGGTIEIRHQADDAWERLVTGHDPAAGVLSADFASERRTPGLWQVRASVTDRAGNQVVVDRLPDGGVLEVRAPARTETELVAGLVTGGRPSASVVVRFGQGARVEGRLADRSGRGLPDQQVRVVVTPRLATSGGTEVRTVETGPGGRFSLRLGPGSGRRVSTHFAGTRRLMASSSGPLELEVRAVVSFSARPRRLGNGDSVRFRGAIGPRLAARHSVGSLVEIQYLETGSGSWRPVLVTRVRRGGGFVARYRFRYVTRPTRIRFRARMLAAPRLPFATGLSKVVPVLVAGG